MLEEGKCLDKQASWLIKSLMLAAERAVVDSILASRAVDKAGEPVVSAKSVLVVKAESKERVLKSVSANKSKLYTSVDQDSGYQ